MMMKALDRIHVTSLSKEAKELPEKEVYGKRSVMGKVGLYLNKSIAIILLLAVWSSICLTGLVSPSLLPSPWKVLGCGWSMIVSGQLLVHIEASMIRVVIGFLIAFLIALPLGLIMGSVKKIRIALEPLIELFRPIPPIAMIPLSILWFGIGEGSKVFIIAWAAVFPILLNVYGGVLQVDKIHIRAAQTLGANRLQIFRDVILRSAVPNIIIGMRNGISMAFISLVAAELIASQAGLGFLIQEAKYLYKTDEVMLGIVVIGLIGFIINKVLVWAEKKLTTWQ